MGIMDRKWPGFLPNGVDLFSTVLDSEIDTMQGALVPNCRSSQGRNPEISCYSAMGDSVSFRVSSMYTCVCV